MYEHKSSPLLSRAAFTRRVIRHVLAALIIVVSAVVIGVLGYHWLAELGWLDSLLNAAMILSGMGPVDALHKPAAKLFAAGYALFSGVVFIGVASALVAPFAHRLLHRFHLENR